MYYRVKIKKLPGKATGGVAGNKIVPNQTLSFGGADMNMGPKKPELRKTMTAIPRDKANVEVEDNEVIVGDLAGDGMISSAVAKGERHTNGGIPLNLPDDTFIFSDTRSMLIKDPSILAKFGKGSIDGKKTKGYTPAELAKPYDITKYRKILQDPESDAIDRKTAEMMIKNYTMKLGALAIAQESKKGFPQGIPSLARPYMQANGIKDEDLIPQLAQNPQEESMEQGPEQNYQEEMVEAPQQMPNGQPIAMPQEMEQGMMPPMAAYGYEVPSYMAYGGYLPEAQEGIVINPYENARTAKGNVTPTGKSNKYSTRDEDIKDYLMQWEGLIPGISKMSEGKAQAAIYDYNLENNPDAIKAMWKEFGLTEEGKKYPELVKLANKGVLKDEALNDPEALKELKKAYVDNYFGARQMKPVKAEAPVEEEVPVEEVPVEEVPAKEIERPDDGSDFEVTPDAPYTANADWMTPDRVNYYGALKDKSMLKKYMPWAPRFEPEVPRGVYLDPTRELGAQSEQANMILQSLAQFAGPQALSSRASSIQGTGAEQAANTLSNINNANVSLANQFAQNAANIRNQAQGINQGASQKLYDQNTVANQAYDNARMAADQNVRQGFNTGWKNASNLALTNGLYDQYDIDPVSGNVVFQGSKDFNPVNSTSISERAAELRQEGWDQKIAYQMAKDEITGRSNVGIDPEAVMENYAQKGGYVLGDNIFPFMFY